MSHHRTPLLLISLVSSAVAACGAQIDAPARQSAAIIGGALDTSDPAVVRLPDANCSGTLVAPRAVLTAAHCGVVAGVTSVQFSDGTSIAALAQHNHPAWDHDTLDNDISIVVLATPSAVTPLPLSDLPFSDSLLGQEVRIVGYGEAGDAGPAGVERTGDTTITAYYPTTFVDSAKPDSTCAGDSGGPALLTVGGVEYVAGVTSRGDLACMSFGVKTRVDAYLASFLMPTIMATYPAAVPVGGECDDSTECDGGQCIAAADSPLVQYCSTMCSSDGDCPSLLRCQAGMCRYPAPSPRAFGASCEQNGDCAGGLCVASSYGGARICSILCASEMGCPAASRCDSIDGQPGMSGCFPTPRRSAGCSFAPGLHRTACWWMLTLTFLLGARRRRRGRVGS